jgi:tetratricopeptide (TPR) repeat protein
MTRKALTLLTLLCFALGSQLWASVAKKKDDDSPAHAHYNRSVDLLKEGDLQGAQKELEEALALDEDFAEAHNNLGYALRRQGKEHYEAALGHYNRALELNAELAEAYMYRGVLHALSGDTDKAREDLEALNKLNRELGDELLQVIASGEEPDGDAGVAPRWE